MTVYFKGLETINENETIYISFNGESSYNEYSVDTCRNGIPIPTEVDDYSTIKIKIGKNALKSFTPEVIKRLTVETSGATDGVEQGYVYFDGVNFTDYGFRISTLPEIDWSPESLYLMEPEYSGITGTFVPLDILTTDDQSVTSFVNNKQTVNVDNRYQIYFYVNSSGGVQFGVDETLLVDVESYTIGSSDIMGMSWDDTIREYLINKNIISGISKYKYDDGVGNEYYRIDMHNYADVYFDEDYGFFTYDAVVRLIIDNYDGKELYFKYGRNMVKTNLVLKYTEDGLPYDGH